MTTSAPKAEAVEAMRGSSVATRMRSTREARRQRSQTCWTSGLAAMRWRGLPGKREELKRAGMMTAQGMGERRLEEGVSVPWAAGNQSVNAGAARLTGGECG